MHAALPRSVLGDGRTDRRRCHEDPCPRSRLIWISIAVLCTGFASQVGAQELPRITRVEEDWVLEISIPDPASNAPQITNVISPTSNLSNVHAVLEMNHSSLPSYRAGGLQFQTWMDEVNLTYGNFPNTSILSTANEVITYTLQMDLAGTQLKFEVVKGASSSTWGNFGGQGYLKTSLATSLADLNGYSPAVSVANSRVGYASHRVKKLVLKQVRYYTSSGLVATDSIERVVHAHTAQ